MTVDIADGVSRWHDTNSQQPKSVAQPGDVVVDLYDCSSDVYDALSSDWAWLLLVREDEKTNFANAIKAQESLDSEDNDLLILEFISSTFTHNGDVEKWLSKNAIPFRKFHDSGYGYAED